MATKALSLKEKLKKTLRLRDFARKFLNIEKNSKILKFLYNKLVKTLPSRLSKKQPSDKFFKYFFRIPDREWIPIADNNRNRVYADSSPENVYTDFRQKENPHDWY